VCELANVASDGTAAPVTGPAIVVLAAELVSDLYGSGRTAVLVIRKQKSGGTYWWSFRIWQPSDPGLRMPSNSGSSTPSAAG
jgi:hypothetical protein